MPGMSGIELLKVQKEAAPDIPFVLVNGQPNLGSASEAIRTGPYVVNAFYEMPALLRGNRPLGLP